MLSPNLFVSDWYKRPVVSSFTMGCKLRKALPSNLSNNALLSCAMAGNTQENGIVRIIAKLRSFNPRLNMMNFHLDTFFAAILASAYITSPNTLKEFLVSGRFPVTRTSAAAPVRIVRACEPPASIRANLSFCLIRGRATLDTLKFTPDGISNTFSRLRRHFSANAVLIPLGGFAHFRSCLGGLGRVAVGMIVIRLSAFCPAEYTRLATVDNPFKVITAVLTDKKSCTHVLSLIACNSSTPSIP